MPLPVLPILAGLASAVGIGAGAYGLGTSIKDRNRASRQRAEADAAARRSSSAGSSGFIPSAQSGNWWSGSPAGVETFNQYTPEQQAALSQALRYSLAGLGQNQFDFSPIESQARRGFAEKTIPGIAERFSALGAQRSSAFGQQLGAAGAGLESDLAAMKQNYNLQQQQALQNLLGIGLKPQFESLYRPGQEGFGSKLGNKLGENLLNPDLWSKGIGAIQDIRNRNASNAAFNAADQAYTASQMANQPQFQYTQDPTTRGGSMASLYNPGNIVSGVTAPSTPFAPPVNSSNQMTNMSALRGLYGL